MTIRNEDKIRDELQFYKDNNDAVHLTLITGYFMNGEVIFFNKDHIIFEDEKLGQIILYFKDISSVMKRELKR